MKVIKPLFVFLIFLSFPLLAQNQQRLQRVHFYSSSVGDTMKVIVLLPAGYDTTKSYPILYLLHGWMGSEIDWTSKTSLESYTSDLQAIIAMPDARNSWYVNSNTDKKLRYEDYIMVDLPRFLESKFRIDTNREAIAGLSMGGYGALVLSMRHPGKFLFAGDLSGAISIPQIIDSTLAGTRNYIYKLKTNPAWQSIIDAFGENDKVFRDDHNIFILLERDRGKPLPYFFMSVGVQDEFRDFIPMHHLLIDSLRAMQYPYEYHEVPGHHNWKFWDGQVKMLILKMRTVMNIN
jgi:S-formylglutathione hydrolase FrmB